MYCVKTGFNVSINGDTYRADLYLQDRKRNVFAVKVNPQSKGYVKESDCQAWFISKEGLRPHETGYPTLMSYELARFETEFASYLAKYNIGIALNSGE